MAAGEILGLLGPNGAGKSTTIKMLTGQLRPKRGRIEILGMPMPRRRTEIQRRIGVCFEEKNLYPTMSGADNLRFFARLFGIRHYDPAPMLERVGLADRGGDHVREYSKGMRQRLMMARTLVNQPDVLFLDEPTDGLDPVSSRMIRELIRSEADRGAAVLLTTHDMLEADEPVRAGRLHRRRPGPHARHPRAAQAPLRPALRPGPQPARRRPGRGARGAAGGRRRRR